MRKIITSCVLLFCLATCYPPESSDKKCSSNAPLFTEELGTSLINNWGNQALNYSPIGKAGYKDVYEGAAYFTANNYLPNAVLLPTVSPLTRVRPQEIYDYFTHFLVNCPNMTNNPGTPQGGGPFTTLTGCGTGVISGYYNFNFDCSHTSANARYTFQFQYLSSPSTISIQIPSGSQSGKTITVNQPGNRWYIVLQNSAELPLGEK